MLISIFLENFAKVLVNVYTVIEMWHLALHCTARSKIIDNVLPVLSREKYFVVMTAMPDSLVSPQDFQRALSLLLQQTTLRTLGDHSRVCLSSVVSLASHWTTDEITHEIQDSRDREYFSLLNDRVSNSVSSCNCIGYVHGWTNFLWHFFFRLCARRRKIAKLKPHEYYDTRVPHTHEYYHHTSTTS